MHRLAAGGRGIGRFSGVSGCVWARYGRTVPSVACRQLETNDRSSSGLLSYKIGLYCVIALKNRRMLLIAIEIDLDVFKAITLRRSSEDESENDVLRQVFGLEAKKPPRPAPPSPSD